MAEATRVDDQTLRCVSPPATAAGEQALEVSLNARDFTVDAVGFLYYDLVTLLLTLTLTLTLTPTRTLTLTSAPTLTLTPTLTPAPTPTLALTRTLRLPGHPLRRGLPASRQRPPCGRHHRGGARRRRQP